MKWWPAIQKVIALTSTIVLMGGYVWYRANGNHFVSLNTGGQNSGGAVSLPSQSSGPTNRNAQSALGTGTDTSFATTIAVSAVMMVGSKAGSMPFRIINHTNSNPLIIYYSVRGGVTSPVPIVLGSVPFARPESNFNLVATDHNGAVTGTFLAGGSAVLKTSPVHWSSSSLMSGSKAAIHVIPVRFYMQEFESFLEPFTTTNLPGPIPHPLATPETSPATNFSLGATKSTPTVTVPANQR